MWSVMATTLLAGGIAEATGSCSAGGGVYSGALAALAARGISGKLGCKSDGFRAQPPGRQMTNRARTCQRRQPKPGRQNGAAQAESAKGADCVEGAMQTAPRRVDARPLPAEGGQCAPHWLEALKSCYRDESLQDSSFLRVSLPPG